LKADTEKCEDMIDWIRSESACIAVRERNSIPPPPLQPTHLTPTPSMPVARGPASLLFPFLLRGKGGANNGDAGDVCAAGGPPFIAFSVLRNTERVPYSFLKARRGFCGVRKKKGGR
jgi:hypothetical protein